MSSRVAPDGVEYPDGPRGTIYVATEEEKRIEPDQLVKVERHGFRMVVLVNVLAKKKSASVGQHSR